MKKSISYRATLMASLLFGPVTVYPTETPGAIQLPEIIVESNRSSDDWNKEELREQIEQVPGGTNLIDLKEFRGSQGSVARVLEAEPGIVVQEFFGGNDQPRINVRGSGIQDNPVSRGILLMADGQPLNQADGSFIIGLIDPEHSRFITAYRGANALMQGSTTLGGAIDFHQRSAFNSPENAIQFEAGSFGLGRFGVELNRRKGAWDWHLQSGHTQSDGWRDHSDARRSNLALNLGWNSDSIENRTYLNWVDNRFDVPFLLSKERSLSDPESVLGDYNTPFDRFMNVEVRDPYRDTQQWRLANQTTWWRGSNRHQVGIVGDWVEDSFRNPAVQTNTDASNIVLDYRFDRSIDITSLGHSDVSLFAQANHGELPRQYYSVDPGTGQLLAAFADADLEADNATLTAELQQQLATDWHLLVALQLAHHQREINDRLTPGLLDSQFDYTAFNPRIGLNFNARPGQRFFANLSRSSEAPTFWQLAISSPNPNDPLNAHLQINDLKLQTATTVELGMMQEGDTLSWQLAWYYSWVKDELISEVQDFAIDGTTVNYDHRTVHQGVELGLNARANPGFFSHDQLTGRAIYTWSDFRFDGGRYDGNRIAGIPVHLLFTELEYFPVPEFGISLDLRWQPEDTHVDHANAGLQQDQYTLLGAKFSWRPKTGLDLYLELDNLTDETYQTAYVVRGFSPDDPNVPTFIPGPARSIHAGLRLHW
ncbi:TonB-dependent receptor family protein [Marinobacter nauticus]|uniref:TonB-dependent receptor family protein n=1 Tax=Marinobacter nauticus TaxID=2743 RepID=UPI003510EE60